MSQPGTLTWLAGHELRLSWREWTGMMPNGKSGWSFFLLLGLVLFVAFMHFLAYALVGEYAVEAPNPTRTTLIFLSAGALMALAIMMSQAMESVTRAFYVRADLDLLLASPVSAKRVFAVRMATIALSSATMALLLAAPFINVLAVMGGARWLAAYAVILSLSMLAVAVALVLTILCFRFLGPRRTRLVSQIAAAVIGGSFLIAIQVAAILSYGTPATGALLQSEVLNTDIAASNSPVWIIARAMTGAPVELAIVVGIGVVVVLATIMLFADGFARYVQAAAGASYAPTRTVAPGRTSWRPFRQMTPGRALRRKEWMLLRRDPWLLSQTLMQILYLIPAGLTLWKLYGASSGVPVILVTILVMAAGQLAGGLAWLAISGEDAPDLVKTAPVSPGRLIRAKIEAVLGAVALVTAPILLALLPLSPWMAISAAGGIAVASISATAIQLWFRAYAAKRSDFRRRHTASRIATFAEAFSALSWASTAALVAAGSWWWIGGAIGSLLVLGITRLLAPRHREGV